MNSDHVYKEIWLNFINRNQISELREKLLFARWYNGHVRIVIIAFCDRLQKISEIR